MQPASFFAPRAPHRIPSQRPKQSPQHSPNQGPLSKARMEAMRRLIDPLIADRAGWLFHDTPLTALARRLAEKLLAYEDTLLLASQVCDHATPSVMAELADLLARQVQVQGLEHIPNSGPAMIVANHPTGIADGIILHHVLAKVRPDIFIYANSDVLRVLPQLEDLILPVEWRHDRRTHAKTRQTMQLTAKAFRQGKLGVIFPSGRLAKRRGLQLFERKWMPSAAMLARKFNIPVIPVHIQARNSNLFYLLDKIHPTLRDITLFYETLNKGRQPFHLTIGAPIAPDSLPVNSDKAIEVIRRKTLDLGGSESHCVSLVRSSPLAHRLTASFG